MTDLQPWYANDRLFVSELAEGHRWATRVADRLRTDGLRVTVPPMTVRKRIRDRHRWTRSDVDLTVYGGRSGRPIALEVKSRRLRFSTPGSYPYPLAMIDTMEGWSKKATRPVAVILVSTITSAAVVASARDFGAWQPIRAHDRTRNIDVESWGCPTVLLRPLSDLAAHLKGT